MGPPEGPRPGVAGGRGGAPAPQPARSGPPGLRRPPGLAPGPARQGPLAPPGSPGSPECSGTLRPCTGLGLVSAGSATRRARLFQREGDWCVVETGPLGRRSSVLAPAPASSLPEARHPTASPIGAPRPPNCSRSGPARSHALLSSSAIEDGTPSPRPPRPPTRRQPECLRRNLPPQIPWGSPHLSVSSPGVTSVGLRSCPQRALRDRRDRSAEASTPGGGAWEPRIPPEVLHPETRRRRA